MAKHRTRTNVMAAVGFAAGCLVAAGCTTASVGGCKQVDPDCVTGSLTVRVFDDASDARHGHPTADPVSATLIRKHAGDEELLASSEEAIWSVSGLEPGKYALRISVGDEPGKRKTVSQRFWIGEGRGKVVHVVLSNESAAIRNTLVAAGCFVAVMALTVESMEHWHPLGGE